MSVIDRRLVTKALVGWIATATAKPCGDHRLPLDLPAPPAPPQKPASYAIVYAIEGGGYWGAPLVAPEASADFVYQVTSVGYSPEQVQWHADAVRRTFLARTATGAFQVAFPALTGLVVADRLPESGPGGIDIEGHHPDQTFTLPERFVLRLVAA